MELMPFGVEFMAEVALCSENAANECTVTVSFGRNRIPTKEQTDELIRMAIEKANEASGVKDYRLKMIEDCGVAPPSEDILPQYRLDAAE